MTDSPSDDLPALRTNSAGTQQFIPAETRALLGPAPITHLEDGDAYERVLSKMAEAVAPTDFVEWTWLKDIVDLVWEAARARRAKAVRLALARRTAIEDILRADWDPELLTADFLGMGIARFADQVYRSIAEDNEDEGEEDEDPAEHEFEAEDQELAAGAGSEESEADDEEGEGETFEDILARLGLTQDAVNDAAYLVALDTIERLQRLIDNANARRDLILREIDRRRDALGRRMREKVASSDEIVDAEFDSVPSPG